MLIVLTFFFLALAQVALNLYDINLILIFFSELAYEAGITWAGKYYLYTMQVDSVVWKVSEALSLFGISMQSISFIVNLKRWWGLIFQKKTPDYMNDEDDYDNDFDN